MRRKVVDNELGLYLQILVSLAVLLGLAFYCWDVGLSHPELNAVLAVVALIATGSLAISIFNLVVEPHRRITVTEAVDVPTPDNTSLQSQCHRCQTNVGKSMRYCPNCGAKLI